VKVPFTLGQVGHFGLAVRDPKASAKWFGRALGLIHQFDFNRGVAVGNDHVTIALMLGEPAPHVLQHMSFHLPDMKTLRAALEFLRQQGVELEDPGDEIGPEAPGSPHVGPVVSRSRRISLGTFRSERGAVRRRRQAYEGESGIRTHGTL